MPSAKSPELSRRQKQLAAARARAAWRVRRRDAIMENFAYGYSQAEIARMGAVSVRTVQREIDRALDARQPMATGRFLRLQTERVMKAIKVVGKALENGDAQAARALPPLMTLLDRYQGACNSPSKPPRRSR